MQKEMLPCLTFSRKLFMTVLTPAHMQLIEGGDDMNDLVNLLVNNGIAVVVVAYFMIRDYKFNNELIKTMTQIQDNLQTLTNKLKGR